jgi:hypothetical protein
LYPEKSEDEIKMMNMSETRKDWDELSAQVQNSIKINSIKQIINPQKPEMKFFLMRLEPSTADIAIQMKKQTIKKLFEEIIKIIP